MSYEVWCDIPGYVGKYQISNLGRVKSLRTNRLLSCKANCRTGYFEVSLYSNGKGKTHLVHRLVAQVYKPCKDTSLEVNHIDEDKSNNDIENLEWCDRSYNTHYGKRLTLSLEDVNNIRQLSSQGMKVNELTTQFNISRSQVYKILGNKQWRL